MAGLAKLIEQATEPTAQDATCAGGAPKQVGKASKPPSATQQIARAAGLTCSGRIARGSSAGVHAALEIPREALEHFGDFVPILKSGDGEDTEKCGHCAA
jgi:hypothetical protein